MLTLENYESLFEQALDHMNGARTEQALAAWEQALSLLDPSLEDWPIEASCVQFNMATCHLRRGDYATSLELCEEVLGVYQSQDYLGSDEAQQVLSLMVESYAASGQLELAAGTAALAWATVRKNLSDYQPVTIATIAKQRAKLARRRGTPDEAEATLGRAIGYFQELTRDGLEVLRLQAELLEARGTNRELGLVFELAEADLSRALRLYEKLDGRESASVRRVRTQLGQLLLTSLGVTL